MTEALKETEDSAATELDECQGQDHLIVRYFFNDLHRGRRNRVAKHLQRCARCQDFYRALAAAFDDCGSA